LNIVRLSDWMWKNALHIWRTASR